MRHALTAVLAAASLSSIAAAQTTPAAPPPSPAQSVIGAAVAKDMDGLMTLYRDLHANPELSLQEVNTATKLAKRLKALKFDVTEKVGGTGVVAVMKNGSGPTLLIRADMDGLPVVEQTGLAFASKVRTKTPEGVETGVMHACGHDTHMTAFIETAKLLAARKDVWKGTLVMILQPAEEVGKGARMMLEDGLYTRFPKPTHAIAFHDAANMAAGQIGYTPGYALANVDSVDILVKGLGGHGAYPQTTRDPIVLASRIVTSLQTLVSREQDPQDPAVVTVGSFQAGAKHNIIPDEAKLLLTVRSYSDETREKLIEGIRRISRGEAIAAGVSEDKMPVVSVKDEFTPSTFNPPEFAEQMAGLLKNHFPDGRVIKTSAVMGGEDFSRFYRADKSINSFIFWVGGVPAEKMAAAQTGQASLPSLHSPFWAPEADKVIATASEAMTVLALDILKKP
ncbi:MULTISPECIES: amidohydrolase [Sphingobium]|uniref:Amidohydrolase n=1 Tax=Sphingobium cupriresistens TaxID=1132417 RepID=A0A8G2DYG4_9SPHN|nr:MULTISPECIES: amidohydrolase [Sphingobium]MBJ7375375.1 amidohydrolase [Sphingobium sp.]MBJ7375450.1 amidohydrolase [Sphingobium sp.]RYM14899.1 amidohydrolase [Sphingobium cupriresistens]WCP14399.1 Hippurate hydrolase [Sphingobium sp. AntQ-1]